MAWYWHLVWVQVQTQCAAFEDQNRHLQNAKAQVIDNHHLWLYVYQCESVWRCGQRLRKRAGVV